MSETTIGVKVVRLVNYGEGGADRIRDVIATVMEREFGTLSYAVHAVRKRNVYHVQGETYRHIGYLPVEAPTVMLCIKLVGVRDPERAETAGQVLQDLFPDPFPPAFDIVGEDNNDDGHNDD